jgi:hypothetical protein
LFIIIGLGSVFRLQQPNAKLGGGQDCGDGLVAAGAADPVHLPGGRGFEPRLGLPEALRVTLLLLRHPERPQRPRTVGGRKQQLDPGEERGVQLERAGVNFVNLHFGQLKKSDKL